MKRIAAIVIASLFVLTAFASLTMPQNTTINHIPVPFPYAQSSPARPYVATSNGLTYTVEPNGTYLWNGHYLRAPPVPYPKVPTIAPDGLPYGAVGAVGAQGHQGPYPYTPGTASYSGAHWNSTAGQTTYVNTTTYWRNETISLGGNISINGATTQLYIIGSIVTFNEPSSVSKWSYGINASLPFGTVPVEPAVIIRNSTLKTSSDSTAPFWANDRYTYYSREFLVDNSTVDETNGNPTISANSYGLASSVATPILLFPYGTIKYSEINGGGNFNDTISNDGELVVSHSIITSAYYYGGSLTNSTLNNDRFRLWNASYSTIENINTSNQSVMNFRGMRIISHLLLENSNVTGSVLISTDITTQIMENDSFVNNTVSSLYGFGGLYDSENMSYIHITISNLKFLYSGGGIGAETSILPFLGSKYAYAKAEYSKLVNITGTDISMGVLSTAYLEYNIFENFSNTINTFAGWGGPMLGGNVLTQYNWYVNMHNTNIQQVGGIGVTASNNTFINVSGVPNPYSGFPNAYAFGVGVGSVPAIHIKIAYNTVYGLYNDSQAFTSGYSGGGIGVSYIKDNVYDCDISSVEYWGVNTNSSYINANGFIALLRFPTSAVSPALIYPYGTDKIQIINSSISAIEIMNASNIAGNNLNTVTPADYNITVTNSYVPSQFLKLFPSQSPNQMFIPDPSSPVYGNLFGFGFGQNINYGTGANPSFLNLTGYLGIYQNQQYDINTSNIKGETTLPIYMNGYQVASMSAATGHYNFTASVNTGTLQYSVSANSVTDQPVTLYWQGQAPSTEYAVAMYDHGSLIDYTNVSSNANGVVTFTYNPATMPLDPVFELTTTISASMPPPTPVSNTFLYLEIGLIAVLSVGLVIPLIIRRQYR